jgi:poly-gamma-glutamate capsule biosynthesis protein CapA/YwtB (metallophosphatase superfamily)
MSTVTLVAVGDILVNREDPDTALSGIRPLLDAADVAFGNLEGVLTDTHPVTPGGWAPALTGTHNARALTGLDVVSLAHNHAMDAGSPGLADTVKELASLGIRPTGAGMTLADALRPVLVERGELRIAVLAATAVLQHGAEAGLHTPGVAPLRADDCYLSPYPGGCAPGLAPRVLSVLNENDWEAVAGAVGQARELADLVVVSLHWGDHTREWVLTDHERLCAELLAEAGANLVLGHHHHGPRGVEVIAGTPVFFGLGHIAFDAPGYFDDPASLGRRTGAAVVELSAAGIQRFGFVPCLIDEVGVARPIGRGEPEWAEALELRERGQEVPGLRAKVVDNGWVFGGCDVVEYTGSADQRP